MRKTTSQIALERIAQILGVDVSVLWRLARALKEATDRQGANLDLWLTHKRGGDNLAPEARHLFNIILALIAGQPSEAVDVVLNIRGWVPQPSYSVTTTRRIERRTVNRNALLVGDQPDSWEEEINVAASEIRESGIDIEGNTFAEYGEWLLHALSHYAPSQLQAWMLEASAGRIEVDLGSGFANIVRTYSRADGSLQFQDVQPFRAAQADLQSEDNHERVERVVRLPLRLLGVAAQLLAEFRAKQGNSLNFPPPGSASPTDPGHENEKASDPARSEASTRLRESRQSQALDTGPHYAHPENMGEKAISQPHKSCAWGAARDNSVPELGLT
jgi:hypothetical protein